MRSGIVAFVTIAALASRLNARDHHAYFGIEGGRFFPDALHGSFTATFTTSGQSPTAGTLVPRVVGGVPALVPVPNIQGYLDFVSPPPLIIGRARVEYAKGRVFDALAGYDFGKARIEGEFSSKHAAFGSFSVNPTFAPAVAAAFAPPASAPLGAPISSAEVTTALSSRPDIQITSLMINGLADIPLHRRVAIFGGPGVGYARVKSFGKSDHLWSFQAQAGLRLSFNRWLDLSVRYRYLTTPSNSRSTVPITLSSARSINTSPPQRGPVEPFDVNFTRTGTLTGTFRGPLSSHSLLVGLLLNLGS